MKKIPAVALLVCIISGSAFAEENQNQNQNQNQAAAYGTNYSTITQLGANNLAAVVQNGSVDGSLNDLGSSSFQSGGNVNMDSQAFVVGSVVGSSSSTVSATNSNNPQLNNTSKAAAIITPLD